MYNKDAVSRGRQTNIEVISMGGFKSRCSTNKKIDTKSGSYFTNLKKFIELFQTVANYLTWDLHVQRKTS